MTRVCNVCQNDLPRTAEFWHKRPIGDGLGLTCKNCAKARAEAWYARNKERAAARNRARYWHDPEFKREEQKEYRASHSEFREAAKARAKRFYHSNLESVRPKNAEYRKTHKVQQSALGKAWYRANKEHCFELAKQWRDAHPEQVRAMRAKQKAIRKNVTGHFTATDITRKYVEQNGMCFYGPHSLEFGYHIDHYIPVGGGRGGTNHAHNIVLACPPCNMQKGVMMPEDFMAQLAKN